MTHSLLPAAENDLQLQAAYYLDVAGEDLADRFYTSLERSIDHVVNWPHTGPSLQISSARLADLRSWPVEGFEDVRIYYRVTEYGVEIVARASWQAGYRKSAL